MVQKDRSSATRAPKKDPVQLQQELKEAKQRVPIGAKFAHHKKPEIHYTINSISTNVLTQRPIVQYTDGTHEWARDYDNFISLVNGAPRFSLVK